jgi:hypothetical protein
MKKFMKNNIGFLFPLVIFSLFTFLSIIGSAPWYVFFAIGIVFVGLIDCWFFNDVNITYL